MRKLNYALWACMALCATLFFTRSARAHGIVGERFFPPTVTTDDPFAADELALPTISYFKNPGSPETKEIDAGFEFDKLILPSLALGVSDTHVFLKPTGQHSVNGWNNLDLSLKYQLWTSERHEAIVSVGVNAEIGGTGSKRTGRESTTTFKPTLFFGKGFGDLPESLGGLQPFAVTGSIGNTFPQKGNANALDWGFALEYSLPYLHQHVKDIGLPKPFRDMIPLVEFAMQTTENRAGGGLTTGTINPGVLWESRYFQVGVEALIPVNSASGKHVGGIIQVWIFIDDLFPKVFGHPIFGGAE